MELTIKNIIIGALIVGSLLFLITMVLTQQKLDKYYPRVCCETFSYDENSTKCCETYGHTKGTCIDDKNYTIGKYSRQIVDDMFCLYDE